ncbi:VOC family protein [Arthrobacter frigidicola]|nr:VOC family protein [Arthrobacter frigidicola]
MRDVSRDTSLAASKVFGRRSADQIGLLVEDLEASVRMWSTATGLTDWRIFTYSRDNIAAPTYRGAAGDFKFRLAIAGSSPQIELIQPMEGPSIYHDWIIEHGFGLHHLGFFVPSIEVALKEFEDSGLEVIQSGRGYGLDLDGGFAYVETPGTFDVVLEAIEVPKRRRPSETL